MDPFLKLSQNSASRKLIQSLRLPIPLPQTLRRERSGWRARLLDDGRVAVGSAPNPQLTHQIAQTLAPSGARVLWSGPAALGRSFEAAAEAWAEPVTTLAQEDKAPPNEVHALLFDATGLDSPEQLAAVYEFFAPRVKALSSGGRVVVFSRPATSPLPETNAARQALEGFTRSLAKELGRRGSTANLVSVEQGAEERIAGPLR
ncbi:MAG: hypothetical protein RJA70_4281, partial [Pseudomonadota bacterium]